MGKILSFANQKGGIGKTTSAINMAAAVAATGKKVLVVDCDPQGNTSSGLGINKKSIRVGAYELLCGRTDAKTATLPSSQENLWIIPTNISLAGAEFELIQLDDRAYRLRKALEPVRDYFDYIFVDCPPSLGILTINALAASDGVVIPMQCEYFALEGLSQLMVTVRKVKELYNKGLEISGILITMYNGRLNLSAQVLGELKKYYADKLFNTIIPRSVRLSEAPSYGLPINKYDPHSKGAEAYAAVAAELMRRI